MSESCDRRGCFGRLGCSFEGSARKAGRTASTGRFGNWVGSCGRSFSWNTSSPPSLGEASTGPTKIESYNAFTNWLNFRDDVIRSGDPVEQEKRVKYRDLVAGAVMLCNVADLTDVLAELREEGHKFTPEHAAKLSPYMTGHLKRFGQYVLDMDGETPPLEPKPLDLVEEEQLTFTPETNPPVVRVLQHRTINEDFHAQKPIYRRADHPSAPRT